ncbi:MBL fold metallo-hydrolase [bacterium]
MQIKILAEGSTTLERKVKKWGLSFLINETVLFDTFGNADILLANIRDMNVDVQKIKTIVISHNHWDHIAGLLPILKMNNNIKVYFPVDMDEDMKKELDILNIKVSQYENQIEIQKNIYKTETLQCIYKNHILKEQFVVIKNNAKISVITGCAHPGIVNILKYVKYHFEEPIDLVMGGFHLNNCTKEEVKSIIYDIGKFGFIRIAPMHCTGSNAVRMIKDVYKDKCIAIKTGMIVNL